MWGLRGCQGCSRGWEPFGLAPGSLWCTGGGWSRAGTGGGPSPILQLPQLSFHRMKRIPSGRRQKMGRRHEPPASGLGVGRPLRAWRWGWEQMSAATLHLAPGSGPCPRAATLFVPSLSRVRLSRHCPFYPHSAIVPPLDLLHLSSPAGPQSLLFLSLFPPSLLHPSFGSLSFLTSASQPHVLSILTLPDPWVSLRSPSLRQRQAGVGPGLGPSPTAAPLPSPPLFV